MYQHAPACLATDPSSSAPMGSLRVPTHGRTASAPIPLHTAPATSASLPCPALSPAVPVLPTPLLSVTPASPASSQQGWLSGATSPLWRLGVRTRT